MARHAILVGLVLLAGCARSEDASVVASSNELQAVEQVSNPEQDDDEIALGDWRETLQDEAPALEFGPTGAPPVFSLRCDARRSVYLQRHGAAPAGDLPMMLVSIGSETRRIAVTGVGGTTPMMRASLAPSDTLVRTLAGATTPITVRIGDAPLLLPPAPAIGTFINRCATGPQSAESNTSADANEVAAETNVSAPAPVRR